MRRLISGGLACDEPSVLEFVALYSESVAGVVSVVVSSVVDFSIFEPVSVVGSLDLKVVEGDGVLCTEGFLWVEGEFFLSWESGDWG